MNTFDTKYGKISLYKNELFIAQPFKNGNYWDLDTMKKLKQYINPNKNILEIGAHAGTSSLVYASFLNTDQKLHAYEPQKNMFKILTHNIYQNNLTDKIIAHNDGIFCYNGSGKMNDIDIDGCGGNVLKRYTSESNDGCNFGGISLGSCGEDINLVTIDSLNLTDIGFIHCDAQGSEPFIFSKSLETIKSNRPVILYENIDLYGRHLYNIVCKSYPQFITESQFDLKKYCMSELKYSKYIDRFNGGIDTLLIP